MSRMIFSEYYLSDHWKNVCKDFLENNPNECYICSSKKRLNVYLKWSKSRHKEKHSDLYLLCGYCYSNVLVYSEENFDNDLWNIAKRFKTQIRQAKYYLEKKNSS